MLDYILDKIDITYYESVKQIKKKKVINKKKVIRKKKSSRSVKSKAPDSLSFLSDDQMNKFGENGIFIYAGGFILLFILMTFAISA